LEHLPQLIRVEVLVCLLSIEFEDKLIDKILRLLIDPDFIGVNRLEYLELLSGLIIKVGINLNLLLILWLANSLHHIITRLDESLIYLILELVHIVSIDTRVELVVCHLELEHLRLRHTTIVR
jgi:hypothetical protein